MKIANKISLSFLVLATIITIISSSVFYFIARNNLKRSIYAQLEITAGENAMHIGTYLEMLKISTQQFSKSVVLENLLRVIKNSPQGDNKAVFDIAMKRLIRTKEANPEIYEFLLLDSAGRIAASSNESHVGADKSMDALFVIGQKNIFIKDAYYSEELKERLIAVATPFLDSETGELLGVLVARVKMTGLDKIVLESATNNKAAEVYIVNKYGYMITPSIFLKNTFLKQKVDTVNFKNCLLHLKPMNIREEHVSISLDYRGVKVLGTHVYIPEMQWCILAEIDESEAFAPLVTIYILFLLILFIVPIIAYLLGLYLAKFIAEPIHKLHKGTEIIGEGNLSYRVGTDSKDEIGQLSRAFDSMSINLQKSTTSIDKLNNEIDQRKLLQDTLFLEKERLAITLLSIGDGVIATDSQGKISLINKIAQNLTGWSDTEAFGIPAEEVFNIINEQTRKVCENPFEKILSSGKSIELGNHTVLISKSGKETAIADSGAPIYDKDGKIIGAVLIFRDVSERVKAEEMLKDSEEKFRTIYESSYDAVMLLTEDCFIDCNNRTLELFGFKTVKEFTKFHPADISPPLQPDGRDSRIASEEYIRETFRSGNSFFEWVHCRRDGGCFPADVLITAFNYGGKRVLQATVRDISERKNKENKLITLSRAVEHNPAAVVVTDKDGNITYVNPKFVQLTGYELNEALGKNPRLLKSGQQSQEFYKNLWNTIIAGDEWRGEFHNKRKDGVLYWESASISAAKDSKGNITNFIAVKEDITERKMMVEELERKNKKLLELDHLKSEFVSVVSHEMRTPLSIIKEGVSLILDQIPGTTNPRQDKILKTSKDSIDRLARIINNLLDISRIESGKVELNSKITDLNDLVNKVMENFQEQIKKKGLRLEINLPQPNLLVSIDEDRIFEVFINLIANAIKFTQEGFIAIKIVDKVKEIECMVSDSGIGMHQENIPKLFTKFTQFDRIDGGGEKGTGLGLSIAKGIVLLHGGKIWAESEFGQGTKIYFTLPK